VDIIQRHVVSRSTPSLYPLRQPHPTSPSRRNRNSLGRYTDYSNGGYQLGLVLSRKHNTFVVPVQTPGLPDILGCNTDLNISARQADSKLPSRTLRYTRRVVGLPPISPSGPPGQTSVFLRHNLSPRSSDRHRQEF
jgi:hypothetical protein